MKHEEANSAFEISDTPAEPVESSPLSVALLFYIVTLSAIAVACTRTLSGNENATWRVLSAVVTMGGGFGMVSGFVAAFVYRTRGLDFVLLPIVGLVVGIFAGTLLVVDAKHFLEIMPIAFAGCWFLILIMLLVARRQTS